MKSINGIISILLGLGALYALVTSSTANEFIVGLGLLLMSIIFLCFMLIEELKEEASRLRRTAIKTKGISNL